MRAGRCHYRRLTPEDRRRTLDATPDLLDAAQDARLDGWHRWELPEMIYARARALDVPCWPALTDSLRDEAWPSHQP